MTDIINHLQALVRQLESPIANMGRQAIYSELATRIKSVIAEADATKPAARGEAVACFRLLYRSVDGGWGNQGRSWVDGAPDQKLVDDSDNHPDRWKIEYAYKRRDERVGVPSDFVAGQIVASRANSYPGCNVEISADIQFCIGDTVWISKVEPGERVGVPDGWIDQLEQCLMDLREGQPGGSSLALARKRIERLLAAKGDA